MANGDEVEEFIADLDERAQEAMRSASAGVQQAVIARGDLSDCRNPSSAVISRIREAKGKEKSKDSPPVDVEDFISSQGLDERAAESLRGCSSDVQRIVMERGDLADCRNPSSVISSRIKEANKRGGGAWSGAKAKLEEVESFLEENTLDERASEALRTCTPEVQRVVIDRGSLAETRNPSAVVLGRIKDAQNKGGGKGGGGGWNDNNWSPMGNMGMMNGGMMNMMFPFGMGNMKGGKGKGGGGFGGGFGGGCGWGADPSYGGWGGDSWGGCGKGFGKFGGGGGGWGKGGGKGGGGGQGVESFIRENNLDDRASEQLRSVGPDCQQAVMERGSLRDTRNPSAVVLGRIRDANKGGGRSSPY